MESICILNIETLHPLLEKLQKEKSIVQNTLEDMDIYLSSILLKGQLLENEKNSYQKIVDSFILKQAEVAFQSYLNEQSETFTKIAKTYGKNVRNTNIIL